MFFISGFAAKYFIETSSKFVIFGYYSLIVLKPGHPYHTIIFLSILPFIIELAITSITTLPTLKLFIKNMVSLRCKMMVKSELENLGLHHIAVELGEVEIIENLTEEKRALFSKALLRSGLELMEDKKSILIEKIKNCVVEVIHYNDDLPHINFSEYLTEKLHYDYKYLSSLFSEVKGTTIEHFIIAHKIERVKELLMYDELSLTEISYKLNYSSVAHLSMQFKKVTGLTPTFFKNMKVMRRQNLDNL